jgi:hypothetical protein
MEEVVQFVVETIFHGAFLLVLLLLILKAFRKEIKMIDNLRLINAIGNTLLLSSVIYFSDLAVWLYRAILSGGEYEQYVITSRFVGPYWWAFWIFLFLPYWLLPQILWIRKFRRNIIFLLIITLIWELSFTIRMYTPYYGNSEWSLYFHAEWTEYLIHLLCYLPVVFVAYLIVYSKKRSFTNL